VHSTYGGPDSYVNLGEWQVIASPEWQPPRTVNLADPVLGGHVAWMFPGPTDPTQPEGMLSEAAESAWAPWVVGMSPISWAIGFADDRAAQVTDLEWVDPPGSDATMRFDAVHVAVSSGSALGPWQDLGTWSLDRAADGTVAPFRLPAPTWARFVRISGAGPADTGYWQMPTTIRVLERPIDTGYRSVLGAWGRGEAAGTFEHLVPPDPSGLELEFDLTDGNDTPETATPLTVDEATAARIRRGEDVDWYSLVVPTGDNMLELTLQARPDAGLVVTMQDAAGAAVELVTVLSATPGELAFTADVQPGATYQVRVEQAPLSTVFTYDTSGSMGAYLSYVTAALRGFAADVTPGEEAVLVMPFGDRPLLDHWSDDPFEIESAVAGAGQPSGSSAAEASIMAAASELHGRPGARAILVVTDAETTSYGNSADLWAALDDVRPIIFTIHAAGGNYPSLTNGLMHDWAASWGGRYEYASSHAQIDRAFDRLATWLRRPAAYDVRFSTHYVSHEPGSLSVMSSGGSDGAGSLVAGSAVAVEILLDTSGSMLRKTEGGRRIDVAKDVLTRLVTETLPAGVPTALRIFKPGKKSCASRLVAPLGPLDPAAMADLVDRLKINKGTSTPLAATLREVGSDLSAAQGLRIIVLITDGKETCKGDPAQVIRDLVAEGLDVRVNIVGFAIDDEGLREQLAQWAALGNGRAFDANGADELERSIAAALAAPFRVLDADGVVVGTGVVGEAAIPLPPGTYRVEILTDPIIVRDGVEVPAETSVSLTVDPPDPAASPAP
jgi:Mg-chelatase subunit ChlD